MTKRKFQLFKAKPKQLYKLYIQFYNKKHKNWFFIQLENGLYSF